MNILVTGAFGNVGRSTLKALLARGERFAVLEEKRPGAERLASRLARELGLPGGRFPELFLGDIRDPRLAARAVAGRDAIIHLAALIPPAADIHPELARAVNVGGTKKLLDAAKALGPSAPRFIFASSVAAYGDRLADCWIGVGDPLSPSPGDEYGRTKVEAEALVRASGLSFSILRLSYIVWRKKLRRDPLMYHMPLATKLEICHTEDAGRAFAAAAANSEALGRTFNIGGGESCRTSYRDYLDAMLRLFGLGGLKALPEEAFAASGFHCGWFLDSDEAERVLRFRRKSLADYYVEVAEEASWTRIGGLLFRPLLRPRLFAASPFLRPRPGPLQA